MIASWLQQLGWAKPATGPEKLLFIAYEEPAAKSAAIRRLSGFLALPLCLHVGKHGIRASSRPARRLP
jgi:hypothetical protein